jgi:CRISPR-associated protein Cmr2
MFLSNALMNFARDARKIIKDSGGVTVYAGGEDFLGIVKRDSLLTVLNELRTAFSQIDLTPYISDRRQLTFSAGAVIAHYKEPLSNVMRYLGEAEHIAKSIDASKDAMAVCVIKHSGETIMTRMKFNDKTICDLTDNLQKITDLLVSKQLPASFAYKLQAFVYQYKQSLEQNCECNPNAIFAEINRLCKINGGSALTAVEQPLLELLYRRTGMEGFIDWLKVCLFLRRKAPKDVG